MALAGWNTEQMVAGLPAVLDLAAAAQMDLAEASDIVTDNVTAFGLSVEDSAHLADVMAYAMSHSNTDVTQLGEAYKNVAATAASLGYTVEDTTAVLMTMANAGIKGGEAGTALNAVMTRIATNTSDAADKLQELGIKVYDSNGNIVALSEILEGLSEEWGTLTDEEQANLSKIIAGQHHYAAFNTIMQGVSDEAKKGGQSFQDYTKALKTCDGAAKEMSATMNDNLEGDLKTLNSVWQDFQLTLYKTESGAMRKIVQTISNDLIPALESLFTGTDDFKEKFTDAFTGILDNVGDIGGDLVGRLFGEEAGAATEKIISTISDVVEEIIGLFDEIGPIIATITETSSQVISQILPPIIDIVKELLPFIQKIAEVVGKLINSIIPTITPALEAIGEVLGPILDILTPILEVLGAIFDVIGMVTSGIAWFFSGCPKVAENFEEVMDATKDLSRELDRSVSSWDSMMRSQEQAFSKADVEISKIDMLKTELDGLVTSNGKVKKGYEDRANYVVQQLSQATGQEIEIVDGQIKKYNELKQSIEDVIAQKQAAALQDFYQGIIDTYQGGAMTLGKNLMDVRDGIASVMQTMSETTEGTDQWNEANERLIELQQQEADLNKQIPTYLNAITSAEQLSTAVSKEDWETVKQMYEEKPAVYYKDNKAYEASALEEMQISEYLRDTMIQNEEDLTASGDKEQAKRAASEAKAYDQQSKTAKKAWENQKADLAAHYAQQYAQTGNWGSLMMSKFFSIGSGTQQQEAAGINAKADSVSTAVYNAMTGAKDSGDGVDFTSLGTGAIDGILSGLESKGGWIGDKIAKILREAKEKGNKELEINSPSKVFARMGSGIMEGLAKGIDDNAYRATISLDRSLTEVVDIADNTITMIPSLAAMSMFDSIGAQDSNLLFAINGLRGDIKRANLGVNNYVVNGVTYDDGSNVSGAVRDLIHAAKIERRV